MAWSWQCRVDSHANKQYFPYTNQGVVVPKHSQPICTVLSQNTIWNEPKEMLNSKCQRKEDVCVSLRPVSWGFCCFILRIGVIVKAMCVGLKFSCVELFSFRVFFFFFKSVLEMGHGLESLVHCTLTLNSVFKTMTPHHFFENHHKLCSFVSGSLVCTTPL